MVNPMERVSFASQIFSVIWYSSTESANPHRKKKALRMVWERDIFTAPEPIVDWSQMFGKSKTPQFRFTHVLRYRTIDLNGYVTGVALLYE